MTGLGCDERQLGTWRDHIVTIRTNIAQSTSRFMQSILTKGRCMTEEMHKSDHFEKGPSGRMIWF